MYISDKFYLLPILCWLMTAGGQPDKPIMCINGTTLFQVDPVCKSDTGKLYILLMELIYIYITGHKSCFS